LSSEIIEEIQSLKKSRDAILLVHNYQEPKIQELGDFIGDSLGLARKATNTTNKIIVFAGTVFMAETAAILNPDKKVLIPSFEAKCPLARMISPEQILYYKNKYPKATVAVYVNTTAEIKAMADICITSGNAAKIVSLLDNDQILVGPDRNLAWHIQNQNPDKEIIPIPEIGYCYVHRKFNPSDIQNLMKKHTDAKILVHPEADPSVQKLADQVCSTSGMLKYVKNSKAKKFIIATEIGLVDRLRCEFPLKIFIPARNDAICVEQKNINIYNLYLSFLNEQYKITIPSEISNKARMSIEKMFELS
jgi:quinolinate synthase